MTVQQLYDWLDGFAPFDTAEDFDNPGLLTGKMAQEVTGVLVALDCTPQTVAEAEKLGANVILTHHPLMFSPRRELREDSYEGALLCGLIRGRIALLAAHTNLDKAPGGINDALAAQLGLAAQPGLAEAAGQAYVRVGRLPRPMAAGELAAYCETRLHTPVRLCGGAAQPIAWLGVGSGACSGEWALARQLGAQAYLTGEVKHHHAIEGAQAGFPLLEAGHFATENPGMDALAAALQKALDTLQYKVSVYRTQSTPYGEAMQ